MHPRGLGALLGARPSLARVSLWVGNSVKRGEQVPSPLQVAVWLLYRKVRTKLFSFLRTRKQEAAHVNPTFNPTRGGTLLRSERLVGTLPLSLCFRVGLPLRNY